MEIKLEQDEVLNLLGKALGYDLSEHDVIIKGKPFSITIKNVKNVATPGVVPATLPKNPGPTVTQVATATAEVPVFTLEELLMANNELIQKKPDCPPAKRPLGPGESDEGPPFDPREIGD